MRDERLLCQVDSLTYNFNGHTGVLHMPEQSCCDMYGCINLFKQLDPDVWLIQTFTGGKRGTIYRKNDECVWEAV